MLPLGVQSKIVVSFPDQSSKKCYPLGGHTISTAGVWVRSCADEGKRLEYDACPLSVHKLIHAKPRSLREPDAHMDPRRRRPFIKAGQPADRRGP